MKGIVSQRRGGAGSPHYLYRVPPSVLHVTQPTVGGVPRCVIDVVTGQVEEGWRVTVASPNSGDLPGRIVALGAQHETWPAGRVPGPPRLSEIVPWRHASELVALRDIVTRVRPDVVHLHSTKAGMVGRVLLRGRLATLFQPNGWSFLAVNGVPRRAACSWERLASRWTTTLVCVSRREAADAGAVGINGHRRVLPNAVDVDLFQLATDDDRRRVRAELGLGPGPLAVCVGRLSRQKGQDLLVNVWPAVRAAVPDAALALVGDGPARASLARASGDGVSLVGQRHDVQAWLAAADLVVLPSRWEGMSYVMLEAMASGRSVVASDVGGAREVIDGGTTRAGALVPPEDGHALVAAVVERLTDAEVASTEGMEGGRRARADHDIRYWREAMNGITLDAMQDRPLSSSV